MENSLAKAKILALRVKEEIQPGLEFYHKTGTVRRYSYLISNNAA